MAKKVKNQQNLNILDDNPHGHWIFPDNIQQFPDKTFGFIYLITNLIDKKYYIGCKMVEKTIKRKPLKGKTKRRIEKTESNWKEYTGSSTELNKDIERLGKENFKFQIIDFAFSKSHLKLLELLYQLANNVLFRDDFYNGIINVRLGKIKDFEGVNDFQKFSIIIDK